MSGTVAGRNPIDVHLKTMDGMLQLLECEINATVPAGKRKRVVQIVEKLRREQESLEKSVAALLVSKGGGA